MTTPKRSGTLVDFGSAGAARRRIFCLPFAGGGPAAYRLWRNDLPDDVEVIAVSFPGRNPSERIAPPASIAEITDAVLVDVIELLERDPLPYSFFGHSMGALVAFELTVALQRLGPAPSALFVSGRSAPDHRPDRRPIHGLPDDEFVDAVQRSFGGIPDVILNEPDLLALLLPALRADITAFETYSPLSDQLVTCPVRVYGGEDDRHPSPDELGGWQGVAKQDVSVRIFPGGHFYLATEQVKLTGDITEHWVAD